MSTYIDLDSSKRDLSRYPNPASYTIHAEQIGHWSAHPRKVVGQNPGVQNSVRDIYDSVEIIQVLIPVADYTYVDEHGVTRTGNNTQSLQKIYIDVHTVNFDHKHSISSPHPIDPTGVVGHDRTSSAKFILVRKSVQADENSDNQYLRFETEMDQVIRFDRKREIVVDIMQEDGHTIIISDTSIGTTTLNNGGALGGGDPTVTVADASVFSTSMYARINREYVEITGIAVNTLTINRAQLGSSASSHNDLSRITAVLNRSVQTHITLMLTPYSRDGDYDDHGKGIHKLY